jgi:hypothetical protein
MGCTSRDDRSAAVDPVCSVRGVPVTAGVIKRVVLRPPARASLTHSEYVDAFSVCLVDSLPYLGPSAARQERGRVPPKTSSPSLSERRLGQFRADLTERNATSAEPEVGTRRDELCDACRVCVYRMIRVQRARSVARSSTSKDPMTAKRE